MKDLGSSYYRSCILKRYDHTAHGERQEKNHKNRDQKPIMG